MRVMGEYRFSSLLKQNKKAKICFVIYIAGFFFKKIFCYEVIVKQKIYPLGRSLPATQLRVPLNQVHLQHLSALLTVDVHLVVGYIEGA